MWGKLNVAKAPADIASDLPVGGIAKRAFDVVFSAVAIAASVTVIVVAAVWIKVVSGGPAFFAHQRIGFDGKPFPCLKLRTMELDGDARLQTYFAENPWEKEEFEKNQKLKHDPRIIPGIGSFLRKSSLDELPQFFNVFCGHMSVVGPRPVTAKELERYGRHKSAYIAGRPGITGPWQVSGRSTLSFDDRVEIDANYVKNRSMLKDTMIIFKTVKAVLTADGAC